MPYEIRNLAQFVRECQLMSTLRHPNIVQFLGVCFFPGSRLPALVHGAEHGATAHEPSRLARPGNRPATSTRRAQTAQPKVLHTSQRSQRPSLPPRAIAAHHSPRLVRQKRSPELGDGGQDSGPGRGSYRASYASCSHQGPLSTCLQMPWKTSLDKKRKKKEI